VAPDSSRSAWRLASLVILLAGLGSCRDKAQGNDKPSPAVTTSVQAVEPTGAAAPAPPLPKPTMAGRIYVDVSLGMKGFVHGDSKSLGEVLRLASDAAGEATAKPAVCSLGANSHQCKKDEEIEDADGNKKRRCVYWAEADVTSCSRPATYFADELAYTADISRLDAIVARQPKPERIDPDHPGAPDRIDEAELTVLLASQLDPGPITTSAPSSALACRGGPSPACISAALTERVKQGYGVWLVTLSLRFNGDFVARAAKDKRFVAATDAHLKALKLVATGETPRFSSVEFQVGPQQRDTIPPDPNLSVFHYRGVRPLMIFVVARDPSTGRRFVASLVEKLKASPVLRPGTMTPDEVVQSAELAPLALPTYKLSAVEKLSSVAQEGIDPTAVAEFQFNKSTQDVGGVTADSTCGAKGRAWTAAHFDETPGDGVLAPFVAASPLLRGPIGGGGDSLPPNVSVCDHDSGKPECAVAKDPRSFRIAVNCAPFTIRPTPWLIEYGLRRRVAVDERAMENSFLGQQSSPDTYTMPERVYGLKEVALSLLNMSTVGDVSMGRVQLAVKRVE
jgi:hypothetical protein